MSRQWDELVQAGLKAEAADIDLTKQQSDQILRAIHREKNRRNIKMLAKGKKFLITAAALLALGTMTVIGAGKAVGYRSSINTDEVDFKNAEQLKSAKAELGTIPRAPQQFTNGLTFDRGYLTMVDAMDENDHVIESQPEIHIDYGGSVSLMIQKAAGEYEHPSEPVQTNNINGIQLNAYADEYLFLPPGSTISDEDQILSENGKLNIGYGSETEERSTFRYVIWNRDGLRYNLNSFSDEYSVEELMKMAGEAAAMQ